MMGEWIWKKDIQRGVPIPYIEGTVTQGSYDYQNREMGWSFVRNPSVLM